MKIEEIHKNNFRLVQENNIKVGTELTNKITGQFSKVIHIHSLYGWVVTSPYDLRQDLVNLSEFEINNRNLIIRGLE